MKLPGKLLVCSLLIMLAQCTSGVDQDMRNTDFFDDAINLSQVEFTTQQPNFTGATTIADLIAAITPAQTLRSRTDGTAPNTDSLLTPSLTIEGIVTIPASYGVGFGLGAAPNQGCAASDIYTRSFVVQDSTGGILVAYGLEPAKQDTSQSTSMKYTVNARTPNIAVFGDRIRLTATRAIRYGNTATTGEIPVITDFSNVAVISTRNKIPYAVQTTQLARGNDLYRMRQIEGYVITEPRYVECPNGETRAFQFNFQRGYIGRLCLNATSVTDAATCTGTKIPIKFQMSLYMGAGTLSGFDVGNMFSYKINKDAKVRMRGVVFPPQYDAPDTGADGDGNLSLMLGQRLQVETIP